ncbi:MAG: hypothetical protein KDJ76_11165 [Xanthobacteraceae bacterium]|nr:hypothetical protein [Xanthobacteraceae bacterium]
MNALSPKLFVVPFGALCVLMLLAFNQAPATAERNATATNSRQPVIDCGRATTRACTVAARELHRT